MKTTHLKLTKDLNINGKHHLKNEVVEVPADRAKILIQRGHAEPHTEQMQEAVKPAPKLKKAVKKAPKKKVVNDED